MNLPCFFSFAPTGLFSFFLFCVPGVDTPGCSLRPFRAALAIATDAVRSHRVAALKGRYDHRRRCKPPQSAADAALFFAKVLKIPTRFPRRRRKMWGDRKMFSTMQRINSREQEPTLLLFSLARYLYKSQWQYLCCLSLFFLCDLMLFLRI